MILLPLLDVARLVLFHRLDRSTSKKLRLPVLADAGSRGRLLAS